MKRFTLIVLTLLFMVGCGGPAPEKKASKTEKPVAKQAKKYLAKGMQHLKETNVMEAIRNFDEAIKQNPLDPDPYLLLGQVYMHMRRYDKAIDTFAAASRVAPNSGHVYYFLAMSHGLAGHLDMAKINAQRSVEMFRRSKDEAEFMKALALLQGMMQADEEEEETEKE